MIPSEADLLINKLVRLSTNCPTSIDDENRTVFLGQEKNVTREIGQRLHEIGGHELMIYAYKQVLEYDQLELSHAWDGVGLWKI